MEDRVRSLVHHCGAARLVRPGTVPAKGWGARRCPEGQVAAPLPRARACLAKLVEERWGVWRGCLRALRPCWAH